MSLLSHPRQPRDPDALWFDLTSQLTHSFSFSPKYVVQLLSSEAECAAPFSLVAF